jgi:hypothetical protein
MAARDEDKAMAGLLRRSLAQDAGTGSGEDCPKPEILAAYGKRRAAICIFRAARFAANSLRRWRARAVTMRQRGKLRAPGIGRGGWCPLLLRWWCYW